VSFGLLYDSTQCIGCGACAVACKQENGLPEPIESRTTAYTWTVVESHDDHWMRRLCMHCLAPTCVSVCPVAALQRTPEGPVTYDATRCIGCRYCIMACPFGVPKYQWDRPVPVVGKCVMCHDRVVRGQPTACAEVCPTGATSFGPRDALVREAQSRIAKAPDDYVHHVYGLTEAGGTSVLLLAAAAFETLGLPSHVPREPIPPRTWQVLSQVPAFAGVWGALLFGIHWITKRRDEVRAFEAAERERTGRP